MEEHTTSTWQVRREALRNDDPEFAETMDHPEVVSPDDSVWVADFIEASPEDRIVMLGRSLNEVWNMVDGLMQTVEHIEGHACPHSRDEA
jgi:hypothetical protein